VITLYGFGRIFPEGIGETKDLRVQWALEELGLPYRFHALDHTAGDLETPAYRKLSPFRQAPVIDDDGVILAESTAILMYLAEKAGKPPDTGVMQWCLAAASTISPLLQGIDLVEIFDSEKMAPNLHVEIRKLAQRFLGDLDRYLDGRTWLAASDFTVADIAMANVLRTIRRSDLMTPFANLTAYYTRCHARPAWQNVLELCAARMGVKVDDIR